MANIITTRRLVAEFDIDGIEKIQHLDNSTIGLYPAFEFCKINVTSWEFITLEPVSIEVHALFRSMAEDLKREGIINDEETPVNVQFAKDVSSFVFSFDSERHKVGTTTWAVILTNLVSDFLDDLDNNVRRIDSLSKNPN